MNPVIARLPDGPLDIIGDIHGEIDALRALLTHLGYAHDGAHADDRQLVFVGDFCDRGPDSPAVIDLARCLIDGGRAWAVLGNHELNLLRGDPKQGNGWFFSEGDDHDVAGGKFKDCRRLDDAARDGVLAFLDGLPLALVRDDLRVVHACWHDEAIARLGGVSDGVSALYERFRREVDQLIESRGLSKAAARQEAQYSDELVDHSRQPPLLEQLAARDEIFQAGHPVRALTSGLERTAAEPFWAAGKWRMLDRVRWWETYEAEVPRIAVSFSRTSPGFC